MVCSRCIMVVKAEFEKLSLQPLSVVLGEVELEHEINKESELLLEKELTALGFELIKDKKNQLVENIKNLIVNLVHYKEEELNVNLSDYIATNLLLDYSTLSQYFSEIEQTTIEKFYIAQKIEKVKELLMYDELSLSEISYKLHYSSVAHLSNQFKKITGLTPSQFKKSSTSKRINIENL